MDEKKKLEIQGKTISELKEQIEQLKLMLIDLTEQNETLRKSKEENELSVIEEKEYLEKLIAEYSNLVKELKVLREQIKEEKKIFKSIINDGKKQMNSFLRKNHI